MPSPTLTTVFHPRAFRGRVVGITGGAHGIGEAAVRQLLGLGARVALLDIDKDNLARVKGDLGAYEDALLTFRGDVGDAKFLARSIRATHRRWGRMDAWVNNAMYNSFRPLDLERPRTFTRSWRVNTLAAWQACQLVAPLMRDAGGGAIVNLSSILAHNSYRSNAAYISSKAAVEGLTRALAVELGPDRVRVNAVVPGAIMTGTGPSRRWARRLRLVEPADAQRWRELRQKFREHHSRLTQCWPDFGEAQHVASVILFLISDGAAFMTGACVAVDGGGMVTQPVAMSLPIEEMAGAQAEMRKLAEKYKHLRTWHMRKRGETGKAPAKKG